MTINAFSPLIFGLLSLGAGLYVLLKAEKSFLCRPYFFAAVAMSCYFFMYFVMTHYHNSIDNAMFVLKIFATGAAFIVPALLNILLTLKTKKSGLLKIFLFFSFLFALSSFYYWDKSLLLETDFFQWESVINVNVFSYYLFFLNVSLFLPLGIVIALIKKSKIKPSEIAAKQSRFIILSIGLVDACLLINFAVNFGMSFNFLGSLLMALSFMSIAYAIVRFRCLEFDRIAYKVLLAVLLIGPLLGMHIIISKLFLEVFGYLITTTFSLLVIILMILFAPYKKLIQMFLEKVVYQGKYDYQKVLAELCQGLTVIIEFDQLCDYLIEVIVQTLDAKRIALFLENADSAGYMIKASAGIDSEIQQQLRLDDNSQILNCLKQSSGMLIKSELNQFENESETEILFEPVSAIEAEIIIPLWLNDRLIGIIMLSAKSSAEIYNQGDINVLEVFALEASKALEHARVYSQAIIDNVSKVFNQNYFLTRLREEIARSKRYARPISLLFIAVEDAQSSADIEAERLLLKAIGLLLKTKVRNVDVLGRYSNKMFAVILPETGLSQEKQADNLNKHKQDTMLVANRISQGIENLTGEYKGKIVGLNSSIGFACFNGEDKQFTEEVFIEQAETALNTAKKNKESKIVCFEREK
ncbi:MAG: diguanylate cyclase [Candidatus Omnitrophota bacterium]